MSLKRGRLYCPQVLAAVLISSDGRTDGRTVRKCIHKIETPIDGQSKVYCQHKTPIDILHVISFRNYCSLGRDRNKRDNLYRRVRGGQAVIFLRHGGSRLEEWLGLAQGYNGLHGAHVVEPAAVAIRTTCWTADWIGIRYIYITTAAGMEIIDLQLGLENECNWSDIFVPASATQAAVTAPAPALNSTGISSTTTKISRRYCLTVTRHPQ